MGSILHTSRLPDRLLRLTLLIVAGILLAAAPLPLAVAGMGGAAFMVALLVRPVVGLWLLPFAVPFGSIRALPVAGFNVGATEALIGLTAAAWLARGVAHRRLQIIAPPLLIPLLLLLGAMLLSTKGMYAAAPTVKELVKWTEILIVYGLAFNLIEDRRTATILAATLLLAGALSALHGVAGSLLRVGPPQFAILGGRLHRAFGTFGQPNPFGGYMNHSLPLAASLLIATVLGPRSTADEETRGGSMSLWTLALVGIAGLLVAGLALSWSRGAWLGTAAGLLTVGLAWLLLILRDDAVDPVSPRLRQRAIALLWLGAAALALVVLLGGPSLLPASINARIESAMATFTTFDARGAKITDANFATLERVAHWQAAWEMWRDHFWTGVGIGNYEAAYPEYRLPKWLYALGHAHNIYFNMAAETGLIGVLAYIAFVGSAMWHTWRAARRSTEPVSRGLAVGALGILVALAVHNVFDNMYVHAMGVHLALTLALVSALSRRPRPLTWDPASIPVGSV